MIAKLVETLIWSAETLEQHPVRIGDVVRVVRATVGEVERDYLLPTLRDLAGRRGPRP